MSFGSTKSSMFDLEVLESDPTPTFVLQVSTAVLPFELLYANRAFREGNFRDILLLENRESLLFRSWAQSVGDHVESHHELAGFTWSAHVAPQNATLKAVRATRTISEGEALVATRESKLDGTTSDAWAEGEGATHKQKDELQTRKVFHDQLAELRGIPRANLTARWEGIQRMMEMSDVGVFEYTTGGTLIHANEAWYKLSLHPKDTIAHENFSFMDLVYPDDQATVMSMWNTLVTGSPVTFEMRWKPRPGTNDPAQWVLSACVPIFGEDNVLISIAGNTIDISAQKKAQEATQARVEALEQARASELKFTRFAQLSPTAIYIFVPESGMHFANDQFYELTGHPRTPIDDFEWFSLVADEDMQKVTTDWDDMLKGRRTDGLQFRLKKTWVNQDGVKDNIWVQSSSYPQLDEHHNVHSIMGILFDISQFKWAESVQRRRIEEALEAKRQQENFIDMTSHELRNPLSAVVQCAESAIITLTKLSPQSSTITPTATYGVEYTRDFQEEIDSTIDSLQTIITCSLHQKRVVDDVLTLSKLDSELVVITPVRVQAAVVILEAIKMFDMECQKMGIRLDFQEDESAREFAWVMLDPSRMVQILINLITNAIKFTKDQPTRNITVELGGSWKRPPKVWQDVTFRTDDKPRPCKLDEPGWGNGPKAYLWVKVKDSGCGMTQTEQEKLFARFTQATPRTHVKYGGSGLGLFISKTLASMQGGAIGVSSEKNIGSTFAFFVSTRVCDPPTNYIASLSSCMRAEPGKRAMSFQDAMMAVKLTVLIVEDNLVNQKVLKKQLQRNGWDIHVAGDGQEALDWLKGSAYWVNDKDARSENDASVDANNQAPVRHGSDLDIILLDIEMPILDGLACARQIRDWECRGLLALPPSSSKPGNPEPNSVSPTTSNTGLENTVGENTGTFRIPILAVSANARMEQIQEALRAGMDDAITKPFRIPELWPKIQGLVPGLLDE